MKIRLKVSLSGTRNGRPWPRAGAVVTLPESEARDLIASRIAERYEPEPEPEPVVSVVEPDREPDADDDDDRRPVLDEPDSEPDVPAAEETVTPPLSKKPPTKKSGSKK